MLAPNGPFKDSRQLSPSLKEMLQMLTKEINLQIGQHTQLITLPGFQ